MYRATRKNRQYSIDKLEVVVSPATFLITRRVLVRISSTASYSLFVRGFKSRLADDSAPPSLRLDFPKFNRRSVVCIFLLK